MSRRTAPKQSKRASKPPAKSGPNRRATWITVTALVLLVAAGLIGWATWRSAKPETFATPAGVTNYGGTNAGLLVAGDGPVVVEVYLDFLCPACKQFEAISGPTLDQLAAAKKIQLVWHPLGFLDGLSAPPGYSTRAASSFGCAADSEKELAYGNALFAYQPPEGGPGLSDDQLIDIGGTVGLIAPSFAQCVRDVKYKDWVASLTDDAARRGVNSTPTVYVAGQVVERPTPENLTAAIDAAS